LPSGEIAGCIARLIGTACEVPATIKAASTPVSLCMTYFTAKSGDFVSILGFDGLKEPTLLVTRKAKVRNHDLKISRANFSIAIQIAIRLRGGRVSKIRNNEFEISRPDFAILIHIAIDQNHRSQLR
jgi:hypothetical protein